MSNAAMLAPSVISIDFAVLPAACLYFFLCFTAKWRGFFASSSSKSRSTAFLYVSSSSRTSSASRNSSTVGMFCSSGGASYQIYPMTACSHNNAAWSKNGSAGCPLFSGFRFFCSVFASVRISFGSLIYANGL